MVGIDKRAGGARDAIGHGLSPIVRHERPQDLAIPGEAFKKAYRGNEQAGEKDREHKQATKPLFRREPADGRPVHTGSFPRFAIGVEQNQKKQRRIGSEFQKIRAGQCGSEGEREPGWGGGRKLRNSKFEIRND